MAARQDSLVHNTIHNVTNYRRHASTPVVVEELQQILKKHFLNCEYFADKWNT